MKAESQARGAARPRISALQPFSPRGSPTVTRLYRVADLPFIFAATPPIVPSIMTAYQGIGDPLTATTQA